MEIVRCRECRRRLQAESTTCPHCGGAVVRRRTTNWMAVRDPSHLSAEEESRPFYFFLGAAIFLMLVAALLAFCAAAPPVASLHLPDFAEARQS
ncbi:MAG: hypothetical protein M3418_11985 [Gemmatimonadota bacterium]|nr:hypothetical protein [Gemmatimonadota bacterium]